MTWPQNTLFRAQGINCSAASFNFVFLFGVLRGTVNLKARYGCESLSVAFVLSQSIKKEPGTSAKAPAQIYNHKTRKGNVSCLLILTKIHANPLRQMQKN